MKSKTKIQAAALLAVMAATAGMLTLLFLPIAPERSESIWTISALIAALGALGGWLVWRDAQRPTLAPALIGDQSAATFFALDPQRFARVPLDGNPERGYFFCSRLIAFAPGLYECHFTARFDAGRATKTHSEAVAWKGQEARIVARASWRTKGVSANQRSSKLKFRIETPTRIELRGYAGRDLRAANLVEGHIRRLDGDTRSSVSDELFSWPVQRLHWVVIGTTGICNASCPSCPTNKKMISHLPKKHMEWPIFCRIVDGIADSGIDVVGHVSLGLFGDSLIDPLIVQRAAYFKRRLPHVRLIVTSNGGVATSQLAIELGAYVDEFLFHVEAIDPVLYRELMRPLRAGRVFPKIENFIELCGKPVTISCPVSKRNVHEIPRLTSYWLERGAAQVNPVLINSRCTDRLGFADLAIAASPGRCRGDVVSNLIVDADGSVLGCCEDFQRRNVIGDLKQETLLEALGNERRKALYDDLQGGRWAELPSCAQCQLGDAEEMQRILKRSA